MTRVTVLGGGSWGTALAHVAAQNGHPTVVWTRNPDLAAALRQGRNDRYLPGVALDPGLQATADLDESLDAPEIVINASPSHAVRDVLTMAADRLGSALLVSASKGIEIGTDLRMSEVFARTLGDEVLHRLVVLSGPSFADELVRGLPTAMVAAARHAAPAESVQTLFQNRYARVYTGPDVVGTEFGGALKNVIALAAGMSDGLELGSNARAALMTRGLAEITRLAVRFGAQESTLSGLAGMGDLVLTCTGDLSRNRTVGLAIGRGGSPAEVLDAIDKVVEGVRTARAAHELASREGVEMPLVEAVYLIVHEGVEPRDALARLMAREPKPERWS